MAGCDSWREVQEAADAHRDCSRDDGLQARTRSHTVGHNLPVAVTSKVLVPGGIEWLVFGDQVDRENFRTRQKTDAKRLQPKPVIGEV